MVVKLFPQRFGNCSQRLTMIQLEQRGGTVEDFDGELAICQKGF